MNSLTQVLLVNPFDDVAAKATCPHCGHVNEVLWVGNGQTVQWWPSPVPTHCEHYRGVYSTGSLFTVEARFQ